MEFIKAGSIVRPEPSVGVPLKPFPARAANSF